MERCVAACVAHKEMCGTWRGVWQPVWHMERCVAACVAHGEVCGTWRGDISLFDFKLHWSAGMSLLQRCNLQFALLLYNMKTFYY